MKRYVVKIYANGISHEQVVSDLDDLKILLTVLDKIENDATKNILTPP